MEFFVEKDGVMWYSVENSIRELIRMYQALT